MGIAGWDFRASATIGLTVKIAAFLSNESIMEARLLAGATILSGRGINCSEMP
jgi:hypothetical protein